MSAPAAFMPAKRPKDSAVPSALGVQRLELLVHFQAAHEHEHAGAAEGVGVEGRLAHGEQATGILAEVGIVAGGAQLVVAVDGGHDSLNGQVALRGQVLDGVGHDKALGSLHHGLGGVAQAEAGKHGGVGVHLIVGDEVVHIAVAVGHLVDLVGPLGVEDLPGAQVLGAAQGVGAHGHARELVGDVLPGDVLVHEALAVDVELQVAVNALSLVLFRNREGGGAVQAPARSGGESAPSIEVAPTPEEVLATRCAALAERYGLTPRERDIFPLLAQGHTMPAISERLFVSENTVKSHAKRIYQKLGIHARAELIDLVNRAGDEDAAREQ